MKAERIIATWYDYARDNINGKVHVEMGNLINCFRL